MAVFDAVLDAVCVTEGVGVGLRMRDAMLRPRKVMEERVASASPASHREDSSTPLTKLLEGINCVTFHNR